MIKTGTAVVAAALFLGGCQSMVGSNVTNIQVVTPPDSLFVCRQLRELPDPETATNQEIAQVIERLYRFNRECKINMNSIQSFLDQAETRLAEIQEGNQ